MLKGRFRAATVALAGVLALSLWMDPGIARADGAKASLSAKKTDSKKKTDKKVKIKTKKGKSKGTFSFLEKKARGTDSKKRNWRGTGNTKRKLPAEDRRTIEDDCWSATNDMMCFSDAPMADSATLTGSDARAIAVTLVTNLRFPAPKPIFGPDPNKNEWRMLAVGYPVWLWTEGPTTVSTSASAYGFTFRMTARWRSTTFHLGDGKSVTCTAMTRYSAAVVPGAASPNCGHVYTKPSLPRGTYQVRAVADWDVSWSVAGFSGVVPAYNEASSSIPIGELVALNR